MRNPSQEDTETRNDQIPWVSIESPMKSAAEYLPRRLRAAPHQPNVDHHPHPVEPGRIKGPAKYRQEMQYGTPEWDRHYSNARNTIEGFNGFVKQPTEEDLEQPARRRARGYAFQSLVSAFMIASSNLRKIGKFFTKPRNVQSLQQRRNSNLDQPSTSQDCAAVAHGPPLPMSA